MTVRGMWSWALFPVSSRDPPSSLSPLVQRVLSWGWVLIASQLSILSAEGPTRLKDPFSFSTLRVVSGGSRFLLCGAFFPILRMSPAVRSHFPVAGRLMTPKGRAGSASNSVWDAGWLRLGLQGHHLWLSSLGLTKEAVGIRSRCRPLGKSNGPLELLEDIVGKAGSGGHASQKCEEGRQW